MLARSISLVVALIFALPVNAGSLSLSATTGAQACPTVTAPNGGAMLTTPACIIGADAQLARVVAAYRTKLGLDPAATNAEVFNALAASLWDQIKSETRLYEQNQARISAETGVGAVGMQ